MESENALLKLNHALYELQKIIPGSWKKNRKVGKHNESCKIED